MTNVVEEINMCVWRKLKGIVGEFVDRVSIIHSLFNIKA